MHKFRNTYEEGTIKINLDFRILVLGFKNENYMMFNKNLIVQEV